MTLRVVLVVGFVAIALAKSSEEPSGESDASSRPARQIPRDQGCPYGDCDGLDLGRYANPGTFNGNGGVQTGSTGQAVRPNGYDGSRGRSGLADDRLGQAYRQTSFAAQNGPDRQGRPDQQPSLNFREVTAFQQSNESPAQAELRISNAVQSSNAGQGSDRFQLFGGSNPSGAINPTLGGVDPSFGGFGPTIGGGSPTLDGVNPTLGGFDQSLGGGNPSLGGSSPGLVGVNPPFGGGSPGLDGVNPPFGAGSPGLAGVNPPFGGGSPGLVGVNPPFSGADPSFGGGISSPNCGRLPQWPGLPGATVGPQPGEGWPSFNVIGVSPDRNIGTQGVPICQWMQGVAGNGLGGSARNGGNPGASGSVEYVLLPGPIGPQYVGPSGLRGAFDGSRNFVDWSNAPVDPARSSLTGSLPWINEPGTVGLGASTQPQNRLPVSPNPPTYRPDGAAASWIFPDGTRVLDPRQYGQRFPDNSNRWTRVLNALRIGRIGIRFLAHGIHKLASRT